MITKSGKSWGIYSKQQVTTEWLTVNLNILLKFYPAAYCRKVQVTTTLPQFAVIRSDVVCLFVFRDTLMWATAAMACLIDTKRKYFNGTDVWWCLSQHIAGILEETHAGYHVTTYSYPDYSEWNDCQNADVTLFKLIKRTNVHIKDSACLHVVYSWEHPTSRPTTRAIHDNLVNAPSKIFSPLPVGIYG
jgi:hypothetical protein